MAQQRAERIAARVPRLCLHPWERDAGGPGPQAIPTTPSSPARTPTARPAARSCAPPNLADRHLSHRWRPRISLRPLPADAGLTLPDTKRDTGTACEP
jgi:hypothetical protein